MQRNDCFQTLQRSAHLSPDYSKDLTNPVHAASEYTNEKYNRSYFVTRVLLNTRFGESLACRRVYGHIAVYG